jgi:hypothetical protein
MDEAEQLADHVVIVDHGQVVADAQPRTDAGRLRFRAEPDLDTPETCWPRCKPGQAAIPVQAPGQVTGRSGPQLLAAVTAWCDRGVLAQSLRIEPHAGGRVPRADRAGAAVMTQTRLPRARTLSSKPGKPRAGAAPLPRMVAAQAGPLRTMVRNGEQLLLVVIIGTAGRVQPGTADQLRPGRRIDFLAPGILALAILSRRSPARPSRPGSSAVRVSGSARRR